MSLTFPEPSSDLRSKYGDSIWLRSIVQVVPYFGPLIDNALTIPASAHERENLYGFLKEVHEHIDQFKKFQLSSEAGQRPSILPNILNDVRWARDERKVAYYRNMLWHYDFFRSRDGSKALETFPEHFLSVIRGYSTAHFDALLEFDYIFRAGETVMFQGNELPKFGEHLNIPGGCLMKILLDFERDCLIEVEFVDNKKRYSLRAVEWIAQTNLWDEFFMCVIRPPLFENGNPPVRKAAGPQATSD